MKPLLIYLAVFPALLLGWYFGYKTSTAHAAATTVTYYATSLNGCTAQGGGGTCSVTLTWPNGGFSDANYQVNCGYYMYWFYNNTYYGPYYDIERNGVVPVGSDRIAYVLASNNLTVTFTGGSGSAAVEKLVDLVCFATHN